MTDDPERARLEQTYGGYRTEGRDQARWAPEQPGNRCILDERSEIVGDLLPEIVGDGPVLEIGCGSGAVLREIGAVSGPEVVRVGVDLLGDRLRDAREVGESVVQGDGRRLPFADDQFSVVVAFTVFSSILDATVRQAMASEMARVLAPGGSILWYDMRYPSPNRAVRPLTRHRVRQFFPGFDVRLRSVTVIPQVARALGGWDRTLYPLIGRIPLTRSHLIGLLAPIPTTITSESDR